MQWWTHSRGKIERFFRTLRGQLLPLLQDADLESLQALNRRLARWIEDEYHHEPHSSLGETPLQRWAARCGRLRWPEPGLDLRRIFLQRFRRRVSKDCVVSLHGCHYEVELVLAGKSVTLLRDPEAPAERPLEVELDGEPAGRAVLLDAYANARSGRRRTRSPRRPAAGDERAAAPRRRTRQPRQPRQPRQGGLMYRQHFGLTRFPFEEPEHPDRLFASRAIEEADTRLRHLLELRGIGLLTGEAGSGKTSACRRFTDGLNPGHHRVFYVSLTTGSVLDCCQILAWELGLQVSRYRSLAYRAIRAEVRRLSEDLRTLPLLVVDEAHHLSHAVLEDLRLLTNFSMDSKRHLCLLLVGLPPLRQTLNLRVNESLRQRIVVSHSLSGLRRDELEPYLRQRLSQAGCDVPLFEPQAAEALYLAGRGLPREINRIAHFALMAAALDEARQVSERHVQSGCSEAQP